MHMQDNDFSQQMHNSFGVLSIALGVMLAVEMWTLKISLWIGFFGILGGLIILFMSETPVHYFRRHLRWGPNILLLTLANVTTLVFLIILVIASRKRMQGDALPLEEAIERTERSREEFTGCKPSHFD